MHTWIFTACLDYFILKVYGWTLIGIIWCLGLLDRFGEIKVWSYRKYGLILTSFKHTKAPFFGSLQHVWTTSLFDLLFQILIVSFVCFSYCLQYIWWYWWLYWLFMYNMIWFCFIYLSRCWLLIFFVIVYWLVMFYCW